jgi:hypothetical protein
MVKFGEKGGRLREKVLTFESRNGVFFQLDDSFLAALDLAVYIPPDTLDDRLKSLAQGEAHVAKLVETFFTPNPFSNGVDGKGDIRCPVRPCVGPRNTDEREGMDILFCQHGGDHSLDSPVLPASSNPVPPELSAGDLSASCLRGREPKPLIFRLLLPVLVEVGPDEACRLLCPPTRKKVNIIGKQAIPDTCDALPLRKIPWRVGFVGIEKCDCTVDRVTGHSK